MRASRAAMNDTSGSNSSFFKTTSSTKKQITVQISSEMLMLKACASLVPGFSAELADQQKRDQQAVDRQRFEQAHGDDHV